MQAKSRRQMSKEFVLFCEARTGSYNLVSRLDSCPDIICHGEIFKKNSLELPKYHRSNIKIRDKNARNICPKNYIQQIRILNPFKIFGFKFFCHHLNWAPGVVRYLIDPSVKRIILHRDPLAMFASATRAAETGEWTLRQDDKKGNRSATLQLPFREEKFDAFCANYNRFTATCHMLAAIDNTFIINYNQTNDDTVLDCLLSFLGSHASGRDTTTTFRKQFSGAVKDAFVNWDALEKRLQATALLEGPAPTIGAPPSSPQYA